MNDIYSGRSAQPLNSERLIFPYQLFLTRVVPLGVTRQPQLVFIMPLDPEKYLHHMADWKISDADKKALIHSLAMMMQPFVEQAFQDAAAPEAKAVLRHEFDQSNSSPINSTKPQFIEKFSKAASTEEKTANKE